MNYDNEFIDKISDINDTAKSKGFINGKDWAKQAFEQGKISFAERSTFINICSLRVNQAHGNARDIRITQKTYGNACFMLTCIQQLNVNPNKKEYRKKQNYTPAYTNYESSSNYYSAYPYPKYGSLKDYTFKKYIFGQPSYNYLPDLFLEKLWDCLDGIFKYEGITDDAYRFDGHYYGAKGQKIAEQNYSKITYITRNGMPIIPPDTECLTIFLIGSNSQNTEAGYFFKFNNYEVLEEFRNGSFIFGTYLKDFSKSELIFCPHGLYYYSYDDLTKVLNGTDVILNNI